MIKALLIIFIAGVIILAIVASASDAGSKCCGTCRNYNCEYHHCMKHLTMLNEFEEACSDYEDYRIR